MIYIISYGDKEKESTFFLSKEPKPESPNVLEWGTFLSTAHQFETHAAAQKVVDGSMANFENIYIMPIRMGERTGETESASERG